MVRMKCCMCNKEINLTEEEQFFYAKSIGYDIEEQPVLIGDICSECAEKMEKLGFDLLTYNC